MRYEFAMEREATLHQKKGLEVFLSARYRISLASTSNPGEKMGVYHNIITSPPPYLWSYPISYPGSLGDEQLINPQTTPSRGKNRGNPFQRQQSQHISHAQHDTIPPDSLHYRPGFLGIRCPYRGTPDVISWKPRGRSIATPQIVSPVKYFVQNSPRNSSQNHNLSPCFYPITNN